MTAHHQIIQYQLQDYFRSISRRSKTSVRSVVKITRISV